MNWEQIIPNRRGGRYSSPHDLNHVRIAFAKAPATKKSEHNPHLRIYIGKNITKILGISENADRIEFYVDSNHPTRWLIRKAKSDSVTSFSQVSWNKNNKKNIGFQVRWHSQPWMPAEKDYPAKRVWYSFEDGGLVIEFGREPDVQKS